MRATGIVRRIDDLGRILIPKEVREMLHLKEGTAMEIYTNEKKNSIILEKYSENPVQEQLKILDEILKDLETSEEKDEMREHVQAIQELLNKYEQS